jgi:hypothetical protein
MHLGGVLVAVLAAWIGHSDPTLTLRVCAQGYAPVEVEPMTGIEPAYSAWEAFSEGRRR